MRHLLKYLALLFCISNLIAAPSKNLWPYWQKNNPKSNLSIDNSQYQEFLNTYVYSNSEKINLVHYSKVTNTDKQKLNSYIKFLCSQNISAYNKTEQLAFWINLYNALTIQIILNNMPVKSILDIKLSGYLTSGPWDKKLIQIESQQLSLNDIEHRIVRPIWNDPRTHFALNCASYSCPNLQKTAYNQTNLDSMLTSNAKEYINSPRGVFVDSKGKLILSQIFDWYKDDFGNTDSSILEFIKIYANPELKRELSTKHIIDGYNYNWSLNGN